MIDSVSGTMVHTSAAHTIYESLWCGPLPLSPLSDYPQPGLPLSAYPCLPDPALRSDRMQRTHCALPPVCRWHNTQFYAVLDGSSNTKSLPPALSMNAAIIGLPTLSARDFVNSTKARICFPVHFA